MSQILTNEELQTIFQWQESRADDFILDDSQLNQDIVLGFIRQKYGAVTTQALDEAVRACLPALRFMEGHEHPIIKRNKANSQELERKRKRDAEIKAGISNQGKIKTEFDRLEDNVKPAASRSEVLAAARKDTEMQACLSEINARIERHQANTRGGRFDYARTGRERDRLRQELKRLLDRKTKPDAIRARIMELQTSFDNPSVR